MGWLADNMCRNCKWLDRTEENPEAPYVCKRFPPQVCNWSERDCYTSEWPHVSEFDWCGEWRPNE